MICYNLWECCNLHLYLRVAFQYVSLLKPPLHFHQQNKQKKETTCFRTEAINALPVFFSLYVKHWLERMRLQIIQPQNTWSTNLHFINTYVIFFF